MKRTCLLAKSYTGPPMMLAGREIIFSAIANEIIRERGNAFFAAPGPENQTEFSGMVEGILIMWLLAADDFEQIEKFRQHTPQERAAEVLTFAIRHEAWIEELKPQLIARIEAAMAAAVESEGRGKSHPPAQDS